MGPGRFRDRRVAEQAGRARADRAGRTLVEGIAQRELYLAFGAGQGQTFGVFGGRRGA